MLGAGHLQDHAVREGVGHTPRGCMGSGHQQQGEAQLQQRGPAGMPSHCRSVPCALPPAINPHTGGATFVLQ